MHEEPRVIAEIGCNHMGEMEIAREMVVVAATFCKVDVIKFQKRTPKELLTSEEYSSPHPNPRNSYGKTYGEHREYLELTIEDHAELKELCESYDKTYSTSVWDLTSTKEIVELNPKLIKIPSANSTNWPILDYLCRNYSGEIHVSTGMTKREEVEKIVEFFEERKRNRDLILYHCTSGYPVPFEDLCLLEITKLQALYSNRIKSIGFSGHHKGISMDIAAYTLGADWIERHFTLDRTWKGTDHAASLEPDGLRKLVRDLEAANKALEYRPDGLLDIERSQAKKLRWDRREL
jgi:N-acetylneuraminate synthase